MRYYPYCMDNNDAFDLDLMFVNFIKLDYAHVNYTEVQYHR